MGARVCNVGTSTATDVKARFFFDGAKTNTYINLLGLSELTLKDLPPGATPPHPNTISSIPNNCQDAYFNVVITRNRNAYSDRGNDNSTPAQRNTQLYYIEASATGVTPLTTPRPRELFVEKLVSQNRNSVVSFTTVSPATSTVSVGQVLQFRLNAKTATGGYEQLENFPVLPNSMYQILNVSTNYMEPTGAINSTVYGDACGWENNRTSANYHNNGTCIGPANYTGGKVGNDMSSLYTVRVISGGNSGVYNLIYDYSGSSYHYNSDYGTSASGFMVTALAPDLTLTKTHTGNFTVGQPGSFTFTVSAAVTDVYGTTTVTDTLPSGLSLPDGPVTLSGTNATSWSCTSASNTVTCTSTNVDTPGQPNTPFLKAGASSTFNITGIVVGAAAAPGVTNTASVSNPNEDPTKRTNNTASDPVTVTPSADLSISKSGPAAIGSGGAVTYTLQVWNNGPSAVSGVNVSDALPSGFTVTGLTCAATSTPVGATACGTQTFTTSSVTISTGRLALDTVPGNATPDGNFLTYTLTGTAPTSGLLSNTASLTVPSGTVDPFAGNNSTAAAPTQTRIIDAVNDNSPITSSTGGTVPVLNNDTVGGVVATPSNAGVTITNNGGIANLSVVNGQLNVPANTPANTYTVTYQLCDSTVAAACDTATVVITVSASNFACTVPVGVSSSGSGAGTLYTLSGSSFTTLTAVATLAQGSFAVGRAPDGVVYYVGVANGNLYYYNPATNAGGSVRNTANTANIQIAQPQPITTPLNLTTTVTRLAVAPNGTAYAITGNGTVYSFPTNGRLGTVPSTTVTTLGQLQDRSGTAVNLTDGGDFFFDSDGVAWAVLTDLVTSSPTYNQSVLWKLDLGSMTSTNRSVATPIAAVAVNGAVSTANPLNGIVDTGSGLIVTDNNGRVSSFDLGVANMSSGSPLTPTLYDLATCTYRVFRPNLTIDKTVSPTTSVRPGDSLTYTVKVTNTGSAPATTVRLADPIPANTTYRVGSTTLNGTAQPDVSGAMPYATAAAVRSTRSGAAYVYPGAALAAGSTATVSFGVTVNTPMPVGVYTVSNTATLTYDPYGSSSTQQSPTVVTNILVSPNVTLTKTVRNITAATPETTTSTVGKPGDVLEFCLYYRNMGGPAQNFVMTDPLASTITFLSDAYAAGQGLAWAQYAANGTTLQAPIYLTNGADGDQGAFGAYTRGSVTTQNTVQLSLADVAGAGSAGSRGQLCFRATIR
ncbi:putative repeat protein (TIGR01451 family) [Deinococcus sp. HSC-46F16]|uniref:beta strand repeat-containing protein n=1 Tax=Deinococcus sp. HSC-46F16 TaxID=2910968 RepID=UPI00209F8AB4|nr:putative repeat protein (TIGR01451 family) [Deinococcus sp. HSC-46F16]